MCSFPEDSIDQLSISFNFILMRVASVQKTTMPCELARTVRCAMRMRQLEDGISALRVCAPDSNLSYGINISIVKDLLWHLFHGFLCRIEEAGFLAHSRRSSLVARAPGRATSRVGRWRSISRAVQVVVFLRSRDPRDAVTIVDFGGVACHARARIVLLRNVFAILPHVVVCRSHVEVVSGIKKISLFSFCIV
jgi:hypothetical protein